MNDRGGPDHSENEVLSKFPDLARARNLYISLLTKDSSALVNLGYTGAKLIKAKNVLSLLIEAGEINDHITDNPYLSIKSPTLGWAQGLEIYHLPSKQGFYLDAYQDDGALTPGVPNLYADIKRVKSQKVIFPDLPLQVAYIALFEPEADI